LILRFCLWQWTRSFAAGSDLGDAGCTSTAKKLGSRNDLLRGKRTARKKPDSCRKYTKFRRLPEAFLLQREGADLNTSNYVGGGRKLAESRFTNRADLLADENICINIGLTARAKWTSREASREHLGGSRRKFYLVHLLGCENTARALAYSMVPRVGGTVIDCVGRRAMPSLVLGSHQFAGGHGVYGGFSMLGQGALRFHKIFRCGRQRFAERFDKEGS